MMLIEETRLDPATMPVTELGDHLRLGSGFSESTLQTPVLAGFLAAALSAIEAQTGKILVQRIFRWTLDEWADGAEQHLPAAPVQSVLSVDLIDANGGATAIDPARYRLRPHETRPALIGQGVGLPSIPTASQVVIRFEAGMAPDVMGLPHDLIQAVMLLAAHYYEYRSATDLPSASMPFGVSSLIERYKIVRLHVGRSS